MAQRELAVYEWDKGRFQGTIPTLEAVVKLSGDADIEPDDVKVFSAPVGTEWPDETCCVDCLLEAVPGIERVDIPTELYDAISEASDRRYEAQYGPIS